GYDRFFTVEKLRRADYVPQGLRRLISTVADRLPYSAYGKNWLRMISRPSALERYFENNYAPYFFRKQMLQAEWMLPADAAFLSTAFADCLPSKASRTVTQAMYFETASNLTGDM